MGKRHIILNVVQFHAPMGWVQAPSQIHGPAGPIDSRVAGIEKEMKDTAIRSVPELWLDEN